MTTLSSRLSLCTAVALAGLAAALPAAADTLKVHYGVSLIGLPIGAAVVTGELDGNSYKVDASAKLTGLASILSSSKGAASATGALAGTRVAPATFANTSANSTMSRTIRIAMDAGTVEGVDISPPFDPNVKRVPITEADKRNVVDPLSAFLMTVPADKELTGAAACNRTLPVFDGGTRFDIALSYVGTRQVKVKGYAGPVSVCAARYKPISGFRVDSKAAQFMADNKDLEAWVAPVPGNHLVFPFRISVRTTLGTVVIEADDFAATTSHATATRL